MPRPRLHDENLRQRLVQATTELVARHGDTFALRPLAESLDTSTTAIYSLFGSRAALLEAVAEHAASSFADALERVRHDDPMLWILALGVSYRRWVLASPSMFRIVFQPDTTSDAVRAARARSQAPLHESVAAAVEAGFLEGEVDDIAKALFSGVHGFLLLEGIGEVGGDEAYFRFLDHLVRGYCTPEGAARIAEREQLDLETLLAQRNVPTI